MEENKLFSIQIVPGSDDTVFQQRESGIAHTSYLEETAFLSLIQQGNTEMVRQMLGRFVRSGIVVGRLSSSPVRQMRYWAVCCITLGTRYAIQGGLDEMVAFNLSDQCVMHVDQLASSEEIIAYMEEMVIKLTELVRKNAHKNCPASVRACVNYIDQHLHEAIRLSDLADVVGLNEDYLSKLFKKHLGKTVSGYIMDKKLEAAKTMLLKDYSQKMVAYYLSFCSQTYFISCFKKAYGVTPHQFVLMHGNKNGQV